MPEKRIDQIKYRIIKIPFKWILRVEVDTGIDLGEFWRAAALRHFHGRALFISDRVWYARQIPSPGGQVDIIGNVLIVDLNKSP